MFLKISPKGVKLCKEELNLNVINSYHSWWFTILSELFNSREFIFFLKHHWVVIFTSESTFLMVSVFEKFSLPKSVINIYRYWIKKVIWHIFTSFSFSSFSSTRLQVEIYLFGIHQVSFSRAKLEARIKRETKCLSYLAFDYGLI